MNTFINMLAANSSWGLMATLISVALIFVFFAAFMATRYRRCPSNRILVVYGKVSGQRAARCYHGGGTFVYPLIQAYTYISLDPIPIEIDLTSALSMKNIRVNVPSTFTIGVSTDPNIMNNAAERLLDLTEEDIASQSRDIILGQMRLVIATLSIEEINQDREKFLDLVNKNVGFELNKIGLDVINVNIRDITDESGYIEAIGQKAAAEAINIAKVEVAEQEKYGAIGHANATREKEIQVAEQHAQSAIGQKQAERDQRIKTSSLEAEGVAGEASASREQEVAIAEQSALSVQGSKEAEMQQRVKVAELEAEAIKGENESKAEIAKYEATLDERRGEAKRRGEVAMAQAERDILLAEREKEKARLEKEQLVAQEVEKAKVQVDAEAEAEKRRRIARGDADATLARYKAEAEGIQAVLEAKAKGYEKLLQICGDQKQLAPTLLMVEKMPELVAEQVKAIQNLKIDKITVWDSGQSGNGQEIGTTAGFLRSLIGALPPIHELAQQAGIDLPEVLGKIGKGKTETPLSQTPPPKRAKHPGHSPSSETNKGH